MYDPDIMRRAQTVRKKKASIPEHLIAQFCGFTHIALRIYCRKVDDPQRIFPKKARPYEGCIFVHLTDADDHMDQYPYCMITLHNCTIGQFRTVVDKILSCSTTCAHVLTTKTLTH